MKKDEIEFLFESKDELAFLFESNLIENETSTRAHEDLRRAWIFAKENRYDLNLDTVKGIHHKLLERINPKIAGKIRTHDVWVRKDKCLDPRYLSPAMETWCGNFYKDKTSEAIKKRSIEFMKIHPFADGNGRTGRILMNLQRINQDLPVLVIHAGKEQYEYYKWFT